MLSKTVVIEESLEHPVARVSTSKPLSRLCYSITRTTFLVKSLVRSLRAVRYCLNCVVGCNRSIIPSNYANFLVLKDFLSCERFTTALVLQNLLTVIKQKARARLLRASLTKTILYNFYSSMLTKFFQGWPN